MTHDVPPQAQTPASFAALVAGAAGAPGARQSKEQRRFHKLIKEVDALHAMLAQWQEILPALERRVASEIEPLFARYRASRINIVKRLAAVIDSDEINKRHRTKAVEILCWHLAEMLGAGPDAELIELYDRYAEVAYAQAHAEHTDDLGTQAAQDVEHDMDEPSSGATRRATHAAPSATPAFEAEEDFDYVQRGAARKRAAKAQAEAALGAQRADGASKSVREIYRKLASALHPDRELDALQRQRKTVLMQQANQAYARSDLLTLLGLQLQTEQLDGATLGILPRERLLHYNHLLAEQCRQLRATLNDLTAPYAMDNGLAAGALTQETAERAIAREARELKRAIKAYEAELGYFRDIRTIKLVLDDYRLGELDG